MPQEHIAEVQAGANDWAPLNPVLANIQSLTTWLCTPCNACYNNVWLLQCDMRQ